MHKWELKVAVRAWSIYSIINVHNKWSRGGWGEKKLAGYVPLLMISALASYLQLVKGGGGFIFD